jgi:PIN domain nuclease of toxin-antitoxin system
MRSSSGVSVGSSAPVVDASALLALVLDEQGADRVQALVDRAERDATLCSMTAVNWAEVLYRIEQLAGSAAVPAFIEKFDGMPILLVDIDRDLTVRAARLKAARGMGLADAYCAALALTLDAPVLTCDSDFDELQRDGLLEVLRAR